MKKEFTGVIRTEHYCDISGKVVTPKDGYIFTSGHALSSEVAEQFPDWFLEDTDRLILVADEFFKTQSRRELLTPKKGDLRLFIRFKNENDVSDFLKNWKCFENFSSFLSATNVVAFEMKTVQLFFKDGVLVRCVVPRVEEIPVPTSSLIFGKWHEKNERFIEVKHDKLTYLHTNQEFTLSLRDVIRNGNEEEKGRIDIADSSAVYSGFYFINGNELKIKLNHSSQFKEPLQSDMRFAFSFTYTKVTS